MDASDREGADTVDNPLKPLISVIVPIYNVEKYVRKCLESLLHQTLKQIEIIAIDDGSTDESGRIADEYKSDDWPIFRVIHTENRGLSAARNRGIDEAWAEWLMFVDSDDWVDREYCRIPYEAAVRENADMVIINFWDMKKNRKKKSSEMPVGVVDEMTVHEYGSTVAWNKLYKKILFNDIRYPEGRVFEDVATTHKLIHKAARIFILNACLYYHIIRKGSITQTLSVANKRDGFVAAIGKKEDLILYGYPPERINLCGAAIDYLSVSAPSDEPLYWNAVEIINSVKGCPKGLRLKHKVGLIVWRINRSLFYTLCRGLGRV